MSVPDTGHHAASRNDEHSPGASRARGCWEPLARSTPARLGTPYRQVPLLLPLLTRGNWGTGAAPSLLLEGLQAAQKPGSVQKARCSTG